MSLPDKFMGMVDGYSKDVWMCDWNGVKMKPRRVTRNEKWHVIDVKPVDMTAMDIMKEAVHGGWKTGEPGYIFIDTVNKHNTLPGLGPIESSNPCVKKKIILNSKLANIQFNFRVSSFFTTETCAIWER